jgi:hypothetical protein
VLPWQFTGTSFGFTEANDNAKPVTFSSLQTGRPRHSRAPLASCTRSAVAGWSPYPTSARPPTRDVTSASAEKAANGVDASGHRCGGRQYRCRTGLGCILCAVEPWANRDAKVQIDDPVGDARFQDYEL